MNGQEVQTVFAKLDNIFDSLGELKADVRVFEANLENHQKDKSIHHEEPCGAFKTYQATMNKLWVGMVLLGLGGFGTVVWHLLKKG